MNIWEVLFYCDSVSHNKRIQVFFYCLRFLNSVYILKYCSFWFVYKADSESKVALIFFLWKAILCREPFSYFLTQHPETSNTWHTASNTSKFLLCKACNPWLGFRQKYCHSPSTDSVTLSVTSSYRIH